MTTKNLRLQQDNAKWDFGSVSAARTRATALAGMTSGEGRSGIPFVLVDQGTTEAAA